jgi:circadian clock protein KaiC
MILAPQLVNRGKENFDRFDAAKAKDQKKTIRMKIKKMPPPAGLLKAPTGIEGLDEITQGGLPRGQTTLIEGAAGTGKTIMALQSLAYAARFSNEPGIFVAFEERPERIVANAATFGWDLEELRKKNLFFLDARPGE